MTHFAAIRPGQAGNFIQTKCRLLSDPKFKRDGDKIWEEKFPEHVFFIIKEGTETECQIAEAVALNTFKGLGFDVYAPSNPNHY